MSLRLSKGRMLALAATVAAAGCQTMPVDPPQPVVQTVEVKVPVPVPCAALAKLGDEPSYADSNAALQAAPDIFEQVRLLLAGRVQRIQRLVEYFSARASCK